MLKFFIFLVSFSFFQLILLPSYAQDLKKSDPGKLFIKIGAGYAARSGFGSDEEVKEYNDSTYVVNLAPFSYGKGFNISLGLLRMLDENVGLGLDFSYHAGANNETTNQYFIAPGNFKINQKGSHRANAFRINPSLFLIANSKKATPYARMGVIIAFSTAYSEYYETADIPGNFSTGKFKWEYSGGRGTGYSAAIGVNLKTKDPFVNWFFELSHVSMGVSYKKGKRTLYQINDDDLMYTLNTSQKEVVYVDELTYSSTTDPNKPSEYLKHKSSFDGIGINFGVHIKVQ